MTGFLRRLLTRFGNWLGNPDQERRASPVDAQLRLSDDQAITRLIYSKSHFSRQSNRPKPSAFNPSPYSELSTIHITGMTDEDVWTHSVRALGAQPGRQAIHARADIHVAALKPHKLHAVRDDNPFERHTLVLGWPELVDANARKEAWKAICLQLSQSEMVTLALPENPIRRA